MSYNLDSLLRYHIIDRVLVEKAHVGISELISACDSICLGQVLTEELLLRDIETMSLNKELAYFAPIVYEKEKGLYSYKNTSYSIVKLPLNQSEKKALRLIINYLDLLKNHKNFQGLKAMIQKLVDTLQIRNSSENLESPDFVYSELTPGFGGSKFLSPLIEAIQKKRVVRLYYHPFYEDKPYFTLIHPYLIKEYKGRWYLIGLNDTKKELRTYGLDRIWEMNETADSFIPKTFSAADYFKNTVGVISPLGNPPEIQIEVSKHQAQYLITQPLHTSQYIETENDEFVIFNYKLHPTYEFKAMILSMGKDAKVLKPEPFKREVLHELNEAILAYGKGG